MRGTFDGAASFNGNVSTWNTGQVRSMEGLFSRATAFAGSLTHWNVSRVRDMNNCFTDAAAFNSDLSRWDVSHVHDTTMMFFRATSFNQDVSSWNVKRVEDARAMFLGASSFSQNLCDWCTIIGTSVITPKNTKVQIQGHADHVMVDEMFSGTACPVTDDPVVGVHGLNFCEVCFDDSPLTTTAPTGSPTAFAATTPQPAAASTPSSTTTTTTTTNIQFGPAASYTGRLWTLVALLGVVVFVVTCCYRRGQRKEHTPYATVESEIV